MIDGLCDVPEPRVFADGVLNRCSFEFGHTGKHSWQKVQRMSGGPYYPDRQTQAGKLGFERHDLLDEENEPLIEK